MSNSPDEVRKWVFSKVARLQAAIASLDEDNHEERSSLQHALKRAQQQIVVPPVDQRIADCAQFIERAKKRVQIAEAEVKKALESLRVQEGELAAAEHCLIDLQQEAAKVGVVLSTIPQAPAARFQGEVEQLKARFVAAEQERDSLESGRMKFKMGDAISELREAMELCDTSAVLQLTSAIAVICEKLSQMTGAMVM